MTVREAGHLGGEKVKEEYGPEFYSEIGHKGGETVKEKYGPEFYSEIGHKGGQKVKDLIEKGKRETNR
ncbi:Glucose starvation-inducible protein B [compost metagenome]